MQRLSRGDLFQLVLIILMVVATLLFSVFIYREIFPEYRTYQKKYVQLEEFKSSYTGEPVPSFKQKIKQIVIPRKDKGPAKVDRCVSCHVTLQLPDFSPTKLAYDVNGKLIVDQNGFPVKEPNERYIWDILENKILELRDEQVLKQLEKEGNKKEVLKRLEKAKQLESLKTVSVGDNTFDMKKLFKMHPLIGKETRPFEFHPIEEYGCTSCHSGNGRGLTTMKAHGPVFDGQYKTEEKQRVVFTEDDPENDPVFRKAYNFEPGPDLLFQTTPLLVGHLIEASCVQCHDSSKELLINTEDKIKELKENNIQRIESVEEGFLSDKKAVSTLVEIKSALKKEGLENLLLKIKQKAFDYSIPLQERKEFENRYKFLKQEKVKEKIKKQLVSLIGGVDLVEKIDVDTNLDQFLEENKKEITATGTLFEKYRALEGFKQLLSLSKENKQECDKPYIEQSIHSDIDLLTKHFWSGKQQFVSQACYSCHRVAGFSRAGVGPELTESGYNYPWFIKESIVWPQADLPTSIMPNMQLDTEVVEELMTFLLAQKGAPKSMSETEYKEMIKRWESGKKMPFEEALDPDDIFNVRNSMTIYATEGCAACHRLKGFKSNVGFSIEKQSPTVEALEKERSWFKRLIPEDITGSQLVERIETNKEVLFKKIATDVRKNSLLEELEQKNPGLVASFYHPFKYALRAKNSYYKALLADAKTIKEKQKIKKDHENWKHQVHSVLMMYVQEYGLGRLIGPRLNWSGVYRTDEWLVGHFRTPSEYTARSLMPTMPFNETKFYALTYMLNELAKQNLEKQQRVWEEKGFSPEKAYSMLCAQCHGDFKQGNGPVSEWIYPIPKNLSDTIFLKSLSKERAIDSITHGVKGTPMPPFGEVAKDKKDKFKRPVLTHSQIVQLVDWIYFSLPEGKVEKEEKTLKWEYTPEDVIDELKEESDDYYSCLKAKKTPYYASLDPVFSFSDLKTEDVFIKVAAKKGSAEPYLYYIKDQFYTKDNILQGKEFFVENCAICHGKEADGRGLRAETMFDSKPRMLTNLRWIETKDDLYLLRAIKFGVPGTAMTPWGDLTTSLQRLQLVIYIRSLNEKKEKQTQIKSALFESFENQIVAIEKIRSVKTKQIEELEALCFEIKEQIEEVISLIEERKKDPLEAVSLFEEDRKRKEKLKKLQEEDGLLVSFIETIKKIKEVYASFGERIIENEYEEDVFHSIMALIRLYEKKISYKNGRLQLNFNEEDLDKIFKIQENLIKHFDEKIYQLEKQKEIILGKIQSPEKRELLSENAEKLQKITKFKNDMIFGFSTIKRLLKKQQDLFKEYMKGEKTLL